MNHPPKKNSACDECRTRKLRCSGSPSGCERCLRDNASCVYSAQRPMGRPRKRRREEQEEQATTVTTIAIAPGGGRGASPVVSGSVFPGQVEWMRDLMNPTAGFDLSLFPDFANYEPMMLETGYIINGQAKQISPTSPSSSPHSCSNKAYRSHAGTGPFNGPSLNGKISGTFKSLTGNHIPPCNCLSALFSFTSILRAPIPSHSVSLSAALQTSRTALVTATHALKCEDCLGSLQNMYIMNMLLGIMIPILCHFYSQVIDSIDATRSSQKVDIGNLVEIEMDVDQWKEMARAAVMKEARGVLLVVRLMEEMVHSTHASMMRGFALPTNPEPLCAKVVSTVKEIAARAGIR